MNLNDKKFVATENKKGVSSSETIFHYYQKDSTITGTYKGGAVLEGFVVGKKTVPSEIELLFQCITEDGELKSGKSQGVISETKSGTLQLKFDWLWLNGDHSGGVSHYIEID